MSVEDFEQLEPSLATIGYNDLRTPNLPYAVALQEASDLEQLLRREEVRARLFAVGVAMEVIDGLETAIGALREAQSRWIVARDDRKPQELADRETDGFALRSRMLRACRWNLKDSVGAQGVLDRIVEDDGVPDLVQDLQDMAMLVETEVSAFASDTTFAAAEVVEEARSLADAIAQGLSVSRSDEDQDEAKLWRDRAFTHLDRVMTEIRAAGRYAYEGDEKLLSRFSSAYLRQTRRRREGREDENVVNVEESTEAPPTSPTGI